jgi:hypothetical protein
VIPEIATRWTSSTAAASHFLHLINRSGRLPSDTSPENEGPQLEMMALPREVKDMPWLDWAPIMIDSMIGGLTSVADSHFTMKLAPDPPPFIIFSDYETYGFLGFDGWHVVDKRFYPFAFGPVIIDFG